MTKLKFKRLMRKKWIYPALYLTVAALVLVGVFWFQQSSSDVAEQMKDQTGVQDDVDVQDQESVPVTGQEESLQMPVASEQQTTVVTKFFDYDASKEAQESALVLYNNKYYQSEGIDLAKADGSTFDVTAALSGTVTEVKEDPLYGNVVQISHDNKVATVYASLSDVKVEAGSEVKQGDVIGQAGQNSFGQADGVHVHFEVRKDGEPLNPEDFFGTAVGKIEAKEKKANAEEGEDASGEEGQSSTDPAEKQEQPSANVEDPDTEIEPDQSSESEGQMQPAPEEGEAPTQGDAPTEGETPTEGDAPTEGETPTEEDGVPSEETPTEEEEPAPGEDSSSSAATTQA
ncbi:peptidoglycan DD-metalloendopeptidase family protein [Halobacillus naozhouensis]|uniref:Peptidoglycan DD-metalloendopeptidase family protein n=1 Tax=Halobacillus naozhouensis TaxID=554880 RepID=A0ABY8IX68_9BACI|nr:peptidoglycan DD-metalloendopeptidase family protein [Halobacillus naozhouensis]WFT74356.1 peptidoglycan DD-metalloendopeptidase family protein [Halobacillus naozhouensis]